MASRRYYELWNYLHPRSMYHESVADIGVTQFQPLLAVNTIAIAETKYLYFVSQLLLI